ncbi:MULTISPECIES: permease-like cell division protein FtsX [Pseudomonas syringae group]|uniref:Cell division protein FtsX n=2 Tax=Pseudomonas cannabina TaxID=86840 RepID=A0A0P9MCW8_PSECA|nr:MULTISPECIES: permease-like cell division protein FtsX [Pseudomonas syringae group]KAA8710521.1 ABC transporter permease [Pseudomonas cannabina]KPB74014.1 Cell division protein FtsX [Pseudomonas syringae pv. maculicola]KPW16264.1 Cell division protein FtsX [Pseudomonas cannabina pv. alisalensis]KPW80977.1 Cell division protein FtsX [Pseudomonas cannabina]MBM0137789.1 ABC transporter permease [Pseudomonas cannabina pv. alisalensis]
MSATRSPKVSERVAPKAADPLPPKKNKQRHDHDDDGPNFSMLLSAWLESHRSSLVDSLRRLGKQPIGSFFTCLVMAIALSLPMGLSLLLSNVERLGGSWQRAAQISIYLNLDASAADGTRMRDEIKAMPGVADAEYISSDQALSEFKQQSGLGEALKELPENPLPGVVLVTPDEVDKPALEALRTRLAGLPKVEQAQLDLVWVERLAAILKLGDRFVFGLTVLLVSALLLVIGNTIRLHIENRRTEIEVIKLVGGTDSYVRRPFLYMGALYGFGAGILSWGVLAYGLDWLNGAVVGLAGLYGSDFALAGVPLADGFSLLLGAVLLGYIGAWIAVARHLRELAPR